MTPDTAKIPTSHGPARLQMLAVASPRGVLMLGHGAGGGVQAPDLGAAVAAAHATGWSVALVEQAYRVAGRRAPAPARQLDTVWAEVAASLRAAPQTPAALVVGGRSSGARVACRTARELGAVGVLCLAFPLQTPGRPDRPSRLPELDGAGVPTLVVQGEKDPFGMPPTAPGRTVAVVPGDHSLKKDLPAVGSHVQQWLSSLR